MQHGRSSEPSVSAVRASCSEFGWISPVNDAPQTEWRDTPARRLGFRPGLRRQGLLHRPHSQENDVDRPAGQVGSNRSHSSVCRPISLSRHGRRVGQRWLVLCRHQFVILNRPRVITHMRTTPNMHKYPPPIGQEVAPPGKALVLKSGRTCHATVHTGCCQKVMVRDRQNKQFTHAALFLYVRAISI